MKIIFLFWWYGENNFFSRINICRFEKLPKLEQAGEKIWVFRSRMLLSLAHTWATGESFDFKNTDDVSFVRLPFLRATLGEQSNIRTHAILMVSVCYKSEGLHLGLRRECNIKLESVGDERWEGEKSVRAEGWARMRLINAGACFSTKNVRACVTREKESVDR